MIYSLENYLIYLVWTLYAAPQFSLCLKQAVLAPVTLSPPANEPKVLIGLVLESAHQRQCKQQ